jgi:CheY-like chemotaxis protein
MYDLHGNPADDIGSQRHWKLVVADDVMLNADSLSEVLRLLGNEVLTAYDGQAAVAAHQSFMPDAYLLDIGMPGLDGFETCRAIRKLPGGEAVAIVALSGWGRHNDLAYALEVGFSGFLLKPAHPREILLSLSGLWSRKTPPDRRYPG